MSVDPSAELVFSTLLYLILERQIAIARRSLQTLLWPNTAETVSAHRLRQTLFKLRGMGFPISSDGKARVCLNTAEIEVDFERVTSVQSLGVRFPANALPLFEGFEPSFSWEYAQWLDTKRKNIGATIARNLLARITKSRLEGDWLGIENDARSLLAVSPHNEEATLALAEALAMRGEKIEAVRALDGYLREIGRDASDLRVSATVMRKRITERMSPRDDEGEKESPLRGRELFVEMLAHRLYAARQKKPGAVAIWGEAGIGKSRLLREFFEFASLQGASCKRIVCRSTDANRPLSALLELIPLLQAMRGAIGCAPETLAFFQGLTTHRLGARLGNVKRKPIDLFSAGLQAAFCDIIDAVTEDTTLVIGIEDCQWLDTNSASVLASLTQHLRGQRLLIVFTSRLDYQGQLAGNSFDADTIELPGLDDRASEELIHAIVRQRGKVVGPNYLRWCTCVAEGNPFFLHEFANHWLETEEEHHAPPSLTAVLRQRLSRISPNALQLLQTCAILENHASLDNIESVLGHQPHELLHSINELSGAGMLSTSNSVAKTGGVTRLTSRHDLLSEVALAQLSAPAQIFLHRRAAKVLEALIEQGSDASTLWSCAKHWQLAGDTDQAFRLTLSCADHLSVAGLPNEAADAYEKAQGYHSTDDELLKILEGKAAAYYRGSDWRRATQAITEAKAIKRRLSSNFTEHDELELMQLRADWQTLDWNLILTRSLRCLQAEDACVTHRVEAGVMALMMLSFTGDRQRASSIFQSIVELAANTDITAGSIMQARMVYHTHWGSLDDAASAAHELVDHDKVAGDVGRLFRSLCNAAVTFRAAGKFDDAIAHLTEALTLADRHHLYLSKARATPMLANLALELGRNHEAKTWLRELVESPISADDRLGHDEIASISARIALAEGRPAEARMWVDEHLSQMRHDQVAQRRAYRAALAVAVELATNGHATDASLAELQSEYVMTRENLFQGFASYALFTGLKSVGRGDDAERMLTEYLTIYRREPWAPPSHLPEMMLSWIDGPTIQSPTLANRAG
jgi:DNA-binding SARP family transcriptional activator/tetratricopeptide (TPR) repeat protein